MTSVRIDPAGAAWSFATDLSDRPSAAWVTVGGLLDAETIGGTDALLWDDDDVIAAAHSLRDTSTQRSRRSRDAA